MKKLVGLLFVTGLLFASCGKEYDCICTDASGTITEETEKGSDAEDACADASSLIPFKACVPA